MCPYDDPLIRWICLKAVPLPQTDHDTYLKGEEQCFIIGKVGHISPDYPPPWQEEELQPAPKRKKGRSGRPCKKGKKPAQAPAPIRGEPEHSSPMREEPEHPAPQGGDYPLLPSLPLEELELPPPPEGAELQLLMPASPRAAEPATPRAAEPAMPGEACSPSPGALLYPAEAFVLPEILGPEPKRREPSATGKGEEARPPPPAIDALLEYAAPLSLPE
ncbi:UNVERIFIED_CONTAM: hypothetical protein FKN15_029941 [Acipenser sinensis]